jgi:hypothetical protein
MCHDVHSATAYGHFVCKIAVLRLDVVGIDCVVNLGTEICTGTFRLDVVGQATAVALTTPFFPSKGAVPTRAQSPMYYEEYRVSHY